MTDEGRRPLDSALIHRSGVPVSVSEAELAIRRHPAVVDAAVIAVPDHALGEAVCACVVASGTQTALSLAELRSWLASSVEQHTLPDELCIVNAIPRTDRGTVDRRALTAIVIGHGGVAHERLGVSASGSR